MRTTWSLIAATFVIVSCSDGSSDLFSGAAGAAAGGSAGTDSGAGGIPGQGGAAGAAQGGGAGQGGTAGTSGGAGGSAPDAGPDGPVDDCAPAAKLVYLLSREGKLYSFNPGVSGLAAYSEIGTLSCGSTGEPQTMAVDRKANAYVFYTSGEMFQVDTSNASCQKIAAYQHPATGTDVSLGMGMTATSPGASGQTWYVQSPDFGLATIDLQTFAVTKKNVFTGVLAELSGGPDAKLFRFEGSTAQLAEIDLGTFGVSPLHTFSFAQVQAWAIARYAGQFYLFVATAPDPLNPKNATATVYNPGTDTETVRDQDIGFVVVGAGQSTCVPAL
jgi:hypothetical protein